MPGAAAEMLWPRSMWWVACAVVVVLSVLVTAGFVDVVIVGATWPARWTVALAAVAALCWIVAAGLFVLILYRPLRSTAAGMATGPGPVVLPGSRRIAGWMLAVAAAALVLAAVIAWAAAGGWRVFWIIVGVLLLTVVIDQALSIGHVRRLTLTPRGIHAVSFQLDAEVAWDDIGAITWTQGRNGLMVARVAPQPAAASYVVHWRHPFSRRRDAVDVELVTLDLDPLLVMMALTLFWAVPASRDELAVARVPERFFDIDRAVGTVPPELGVGWLGTFRPRRRAAR